MKRWQLKGLVHGVNLLAHALFARLLGDILPYGGAYWALALLFGLSTYRIHRSLPDHPRPRWLIRWVDEPVFAHWGACILALPFLAVGYPFSVARVPSMLAALYVLCLAVSAWAVWGRRRLVRVNHLRIAHENLPAAFDGYRVVHLTDLHVGSFDRVERAREWITRANRENADLVLVTGDLVTSGTWFYEDVASVLGELVSRDGVIVTLGNHDQWDSNRLVEQLSKRGARVLRNDVTVIERGDARLLIAGLDDRFAGRADLGTTLARRPFEGYTILMSHYPDFFPEACASGVELVLSGHTHGGQLGLPWLGERLNVATLTGQRGRGLFSEGSSRLFVNAGLGTTGPPMRLGIAPEIAVLDLHQSAWDTVT